MHSLRRLPLVNRLAATLDDALAIFSAMGHGQRATVRYFTMEDTRTLQLTSIRVDRAWFPARHCVRDDSIGLWPCTPIPAGPDAPPVGSWLPTVTPPSPASVS